MLTQEHRNSLLTIARQSIEAVLTDAGLDLPAEPDPHLRRPSGAFVSLHTPDGDLRGCIGSIHPVLPLYQAVATNAVNAAFRDPRFRPVEHRELGGIHIEISVMSPIERVVDIEEIVVGRDGLIITHAGRAGLLLPQVASEYGWDRETFLEQTCVKAGVSRDAWRRAECRIEKFSAEVFGEPKSR